ncbi:MAG: HAMP domain-containing protein [Planctomyces sp.]|nr:HAMP domain-containing protein [Planctomyces sp.]
MTWNLLDLDTSFPESDAGFQAIDIFEDPDRQDDEHWVFREDDQGTRELVYFAAIRPNPSCLNCHQPPPYHRQQAGDLLSPTSSTNSAANTAETEKENARRNTLMGMVRVGLSMETVEAQLSRNKAILMASAIVTSFLAMMAAYAIVRYIIVKPVSHLKDVSDQIARGNLNLRADINTGDEFEELSHAFNRMLRHMMTVNDELRGLNESLDGKVDQLARANMELFNNNKLKDDFLATMSHELRTPLNSILGFSDILHGAANLDERQKRYVHNIQTSGRSLMVQINDLLDLAKIESGKMDLHLSEVVLHEIIELQVQQVMPLADRRNIDLRIEPCLSQIPVLHQDRGKIMQILNNLLSNAIKFTPEGGRVRVASRMFDPDFFEFSVEDTGIGIPLHEQEHIFEKFRQGTTNPGERDHVTREYEGTGLGLSIVRELARLLGGDVHLQSEFGKGSLFSVRLPVTASDRRLEKHPPLESRSGAGLAGITSADLMGTRSSESVVSADAK